MQFFSRTSRSLILRSGPPQYEERPSLATPEKPARSAVYSPDGKLFAYSSGTTTTVIDPDTESQVIELPVAAADIYFSPLGRHIVTWQRSTRDQTSGNWTPNLQIWDVKTGQKEAEFVQKNQGSVAGGWDAQFSADEKFCVVKTGPKSLAVINADFEPDTLKKRLGSLTLPGPIEDFSVSPGLNPSVSVFVGAQGGKPPFVRVYKLPSLSHPVAQRTLFRAESVRMFWNGLGTAVLVIAQSDVDSSNQSYYGDTSLHLLNVDSGNDQKIMLDRQGPVYDVAWSPDGTEFGVVHGLMPSQTAFFDIRGTEKSSMPLSARNHIKYSPQGTYVVVAGFGNLQGHMDIYDRSRNFTKIGEILATNSSFYDWTPCGRFLLTATTSPRLRVDNGVKLWDFRGRLLYCHDDVELYSVGIRPMKFSSINFTEEFAPHESARDKPLAKPSTKPTGAYLPPHARKSGAQRSVRSLYDTAQLNKTSTAPPSTKKTVGTEVDLLQDKQNQKLKQIRSLVKKLRAIDELKNRDMNGEKLEVTQLKKIETEKEVREKLHALGWSSDEE